MTVWFVFRKLLAEHHDQEYHTALFLPDLSVESCRMFISLLQLQEHTFQVGV